MARPTSETLTPAEQRVMAVLWERGEATGRQVVDALEADHALAYTTVLTVLQVLVKKGHAVSRREGRVHVFAPATSSADARAQAVSQLIRQFFDGSPEALAQHLLSREELDATGLDALEARLRKGKDAP